jgi:hypothetical protein
LYIARDDMGIDTLETRMKQYELRLINEMYESVTIPILPPRSLCICLLLHTFHQSGPHGLIPLQKQISKNVSISDPSLVSRDSSR